MKKKIALGVLAVLIVMQFFGIDKNNPTSDPSKDFLALAGDVEPEVANLIKTACYDCHSHNTKYPWYTSVAPVSWWIKGHIDNAREELNFSTFADYDAGRRSHKLEECAEVLRGKEMRHLYLEQSSYSREGTVEAEYIWVQ